MPPLRIGIVGLGGICRSRHVPGFKAIDDVEIVAVANRSRESGAQAAQEFGIPDVYGSWEELVARDDLDIVVIGTWPYMHRPVSVAALESGKHVFCQARMAMDYGDARAMYDAAQSAGKIAGLCPVPIGMSYDATVARLLAENTLGEIHLVRVTSCSNAFIDRKTPISWRKDHRLSGLNMHTLGMYIEVMHRWFGWTAAVSATAQTFVHERADEQGNATEVRIPDQILVLADMEAGFPVQYTFSTAVHQAQDTIEVFGTKGTLRHDFQRNALEFAEGEGSFESVSVRPEEAYDLANWRVEHSFIDAVRGGAAYHPDFEDGLRYMAVVQAAHDAAALGKQVGLAL